MATHQNRLHSTEHPEKPIYIIYCKVEGSKTNLRQLARAIDRTRKPVKPKYKDQQITGKKEWR